MIIKVDSIIDDIYITDIVSFKYYMEDICGYKLLNEDISNIYQSGYLYNPNKGWLHISFLGNPSEVKRKIREVRFNQLIKKPHI